MGARATGVRGRARWGGCLAAAPLLGGVLLAVALGSGLGPVAAAGAATTSGWAAVDVPYPSTPPPSAERAEEGIACPAPGFCVAVGYVELTPTDTATSRSAGSISVLSAGTWTAVTVPLPATATPTASFFPVAVSCAARNDCVAVGPYHSSSGATVRFAVDIDHAGNWTASLAAPPTGLSSQPEAVACDPTQTCLAAGQYGNADTGQTGEVVAIAADGATTSARLPLPGGAPSDGAAGVMVTGISCPAAGDCAVVGTYLTTTDTTLPFLDLESGGSWSNVALSGWPPDRAPVASDQVSCGAPGTCVATLLAGQSPGVSPYFAVVSAGHVSVVAAPLPAGGRTGAQETATVGAVSCPAAGSCVAVGSYLAGQTAQDVYPGLIETLSDGTWTASVAPTPGNAAHRPTVGFTSIDCPELGQCTAVGQYDDAAGVATPLVETLTTGTWTADPLPVPTGASSGRTASAVTVSCAAGACGAIGTFTGTRGTGGYEPMLLSLPAAFSGYDLVGSDGGVFVFPVGATSGFYGSLPGLGVTPNAPVVGMVPTDSDKGYFLVGADGGVYAFGNAPFLGSLPALGVTPNQPIAGIVAADGDQGYFLVGKDGGVYAFGTVPFLGSLPGRGTAVNDIIGIAATPSGNGYWLVAASGTVYAFGAAQHFGTATGLTSPVSAIAGTPTGGGYWITTQNGTVETFGDAAGFDPGTLPGLGVTPNRAVIGLVRTAETTGYWLLAQDGGIFAFGAAPFDGSLPGLKVTVTDIVGAVPT